jgi:hypothetical protein
VRRWLREDAIKPWQHRSWIFITDPGFRPKAERVLDLYARTWHRQRPATARAALTDPRAERHHLPRHTQTRPPRRHPPRARTRGLTWVDEVFGKRRTLVIDWRSVTTTGAEASISVRFGGNGDALAVGDLRRLATLSN